MAKGGDGVSHHHAAFSSSVGTEAATREKLGQSCGESRKFLTPPLIESAGVA